MPYGTENISPHGPVPVNGTEAARSKMSAVMPDNLCRQMEITPAMFGAVSFPEKSTVRRHLQRDVGLAVKLMGRQMESMARQLIGCRTKEEFCKQRGDVFHKYANSALAVNSMVRSVMTNIDLSEINQKAINSTMKVFRLDGAAYLGVEGKGEVLFCLSTLKRAFRLVKFILAKQVPPELKGEDSSLALQFASQVIFCELNLDCLRLAISGEESLNPEILEEILEGLRASVIAYSTARQAMELRGFSKD